MPDENGNGKDTLDSALQRWDNENNDAGMKDVLKRIESLEGENKELRQRLDNSDSRVERSAYKEDIKPVISNLRGDIKVSDGLVEQWINAEAAKDKALAEAWDKRDEDRATLDEKIEALKPKFQEYITKQAKSVLNVPDEEKTDDDDADDEDKDAKKAKKKTKTTDDDTRGTIQASRVARNANKPVDLNDDYENIDWASLTNQEFAALERRVFADMKSGALKPE